MARARPTITSGDAAAVAACELLLEGLAAQKRVSRSEELGYMPPSLRSG